MSPLFVYKCLKCLKLYEIIVPLAKLDKLIKCPHCKRKLDRVITPPNFTIK